MKSKIQNLFFIFLFIQLNFLSYAMINTVTSAADDGSVGTLRQVISVSNSGDTIVFAIGVIGSSQTITLNPLSGRLLVNKQLTIMGPNHGGGTITISGGNLVDVGFEINVSGSGTKIQNLTMRDFFGNNGSDGSPVGGSGEDAIGILLSSNNCLIDTITFDGSFTGGEGGDGNATGALGGEGGLSAAIRLTEALSNQIINCTINGIYNAGDGGDGANGLGATGPGDGGNGGRAGGIIVDESLHNILNGNFITPTGFFGGGGGEGGNIGAGSGLAGGAGGIGGKIAGILINQASDDNQIINNQVLSNGNGGNGGPGGNGATGGNGGNAGDASNLSIDNISNDNSINQNIFSLGVLVAGNGGAAGMPNGIPGANGIVANVLVLNNSVSNSILTNYIEGTALILGINLVNNGNNEQQEPTLTSAQFCPTSREMFIDGELENTINGSNYLIQFFDNAPSANPNQGRTFIGQITIIGNGATVVFSESFIVPNTVIISAGDNISSTATLGGLATPTDTSEFSNNVATTILPVVTADDEQFAICEDTVLNNMLIGSAPTFQIISAPSNGNAIVTNPNTGAFTYTPNNGFFGIDSFQFIAGANTLCHSEPATVTIEVSEQAFANNSLFQICQNIQLNNQLDGSGALFQIVSGPSHGVAIITDPNSGTFTYTPNLGFVGIDSFEFIAGAGTLCPSQPATVTIEIFEQAIASNESFEICQNTTLNGFLSGNLPLFQITSGPSHGSVEISNPNVGQFIYKPDFQFFGMDSFQFIAGEGTPCPSIPATVTVNVFASVIAKDVNFFTCSNQKLNIFAPGVLENTEILPIQQPVAVEIVVGPTFGAITLNPDGSFVYTPIPGFTGQDSFVFRIIQNVDITCQPSNEATVNIDIRQCCQF